MPSIKKFRAWLKPRWDDDEDAGKMYYDVQNSYDTLGDVKPYDPMNSFDGWLDDEVAIVEQYTGLKDKNGKEIYEGDIVNRYSLSGEYGALFVVKYGKLPDICGHEYCPCLQGFYLDEIDEYEEVDEEGYMEVIGNIHENPELLGGEE